MKKLALIIATASFAFATPVFACPHEEGAAPKTAEKAKDTSNTDKAKEQPTQQEGTTTAKTKTKTKTDTAKKPTKVSRK